MRTTTLVSLSLLLSMVAACDTVDAGKNDILAFQWDVESQLIPPSFATNLAAGTRAGVRVLASETDTTGVNVIHAESSNPAVVEVQGTAGNIITLEGIAPGTAEISVRSVGGDDVFDVSVSALGLIDLDHPGAVAAEADAKGMVGGTARFRMVLKDASGGILIGQGEAVEDGITVDPSNALQLGANQEVGSLALTFSAPGTFTLTGTGDTALTMDVVADADVTALEWTGLDNLTLPVGASSVGYLRGVTGEGDKVVGVAALATVTSSAPQICSITPNVRLGEGVYTIRGVSAGACQITASLGERADTAPVTIE